MIHSESEFAKASLGRASSFTGPAVECKAKEHKSRTGRKVVSKPPVILRRVAIELEASQQRQMQPVEIQLRVNDAWWGDRSA